MKQNIVGHGIEINAKGSAYEQGKTQGSIASVLIAENVESIKEGIEKLKIKPEDYKDLLKNNLTFYEKYFPSIVEELKGISDGSGISLEDIHLINVPLFFVLKWLPQECTSVLARGSATLDGKTYLIKNRDMGSEKVKHVVLNREYEDGSKIIEVNGAGIITFPGSGMNDAGLAVSTSGVWSDKMDFNMERIKDSHILLNMHIILEECKTVDEAIEYLKKAKRMSGMNFVIADKEKGVAVEATQDEIRVINDDSGIIVRSNHYLDPDLVHLNPEREGYPSTYMRHERATSFLKERHGEIRIQEMLQIASDHENDPKNCLCRHGGKDNVGSKTIYTGLSVIEDGQSWTTLSNPCEAIKLTNL